MNMLGIEEARPEETLTLPPLLSFLFLPHSSSSPELNLQRALWGEATLAGAVGSAEGAMAEEQEVMALSGVEAEEGEEEVGAGALEELCEECKLSLGSPTPCLSLLSLTVGRRGEERQEVVSGLSGRLRDEVAGGRRSEQGSDVNPIVLRVLGGACAPELGL